MPKKYKKNSRKSVLGPRCVWVDDEDQFLLKMIKKHGVKKWTVIAEEFKNRTIPSDKTSKQCRERWHNHLNPDINRTTWSNDEEKTFFKLHKKLGNRWSDLSLELQGRTDNAIKNFFYCKLRKMIRKINKGIVSEIDKSTEEQLKQSLYVINHLKYYYILPQYCVTKKKQAASKGDKYIINIVVQNKIDLAKLEKYLSNLLHSTQNLPVEKIAAKFPGLEIHRFFSSLTTENIQKDKESEKLNSSEGTDENSNELEVVPMEASSSPLPSPKCLTDIKLSDFRKFVPSTPEIPSISRVLPVPKNLMNPVFVAMKDDFKPTIFFSEKSPSQLEVMLKWNIKSLANPFQRPLPSIF